MVFALIAGNLWPFTVVCSGFAEYSLPFLDACNTLKCSLAVLFLRG